MLYVSNITDHPFKKDGTGYISKIGLDGSIIEKKWVKGLNAPKGLTIMINYILLTLMISRSRYCDQKNN